MTAGNRQRTANEDDAQRSAALTWAQLVELETELQILLWRARGTDAGCRTLTDLDQGFGPVRNELNSLIGFSGRRYRDSILGSAQAYQVANAKLYDAMADRRPDGDYADKGL